MVGLPRFGMGPGEGFITSAGRPGTTEFPFGNDAFGGPQEGLLTAAASSNVHHRSTHGNKIIERATLREMHCFSGSTSYFSHRSERSGEKRIQGIGLFLLETQRVGVYNPVVNPSQEIFSWPNWKIR